MPVKIKNLPRRILKLPLKGDILENRKPTVYCGNGLEKNNNFNSKFFACRFTAKDLAQLVRNLSDSDMSDAQIESTAQLLEQHKGVAHAEMCQLRQPNDERTHYFKINDFFKNRPPQSNQQYTNKPNQFTQQSNKPPQSTNERDITEMEPPADIINGVDDDIPF